MDQIIKVFLEEIRNTEFSQKDKLLIFMISLILISISIFLNHYIKKIILNPSYFKNKREIEKINSIISLGEKTDGKFQKYIADIAKVELFRIRTGINTNAATVDKYIDLYNKLGNQFTEVHIKRANEFLRLEDGELIPKITRIANWFYIVVRFFCIILLLLISYLSFIIFLTTFDVQIDVKNQLSFLIFSLIMIILSVMGLISTLGYTDAKAIKRRLGDINRG